MSSDVERTNTLSYAITAKDGGAASRGEELAGIINQAMGDEVAAVVAVSAYTARLLVKKEAAPSLRGGNAGDPQGVIPCTEFFKQLGLDQRWGPVGIRTWTGEKEKGDELVVFLPGRGSPEVKQAAAMARIKSKLEEAGFRLLSCTAVKDAPTRL